MLYILGIGGNLLSIIVLDKKEFIVLFSNSYIKVIKVTIDRIVVKDYIRNSLY